MGARGPLRVVGGTDPVPAGTVAAETPLERPKRPAWADENEELATLWEEVVGNVESAGLLSTADAVTLEAVCRHTVMMRMAFREVQRTGTVVVPAQGEDIEKKHPAEAIFRLESAALLELLKQSGMTWMSRARTQAAAAQKEGTGGNPFGAHASGE